MDVFEALNTEVNSAKLSNKYLVLVGLVPTDTFTADNFPQVELAKAYCFRAILTQPDYSEDGLAVNYDRKYLLAEANRIFEQNNLDDLIMGGVPKVNNITGIW